MEHSDFTASSFINQKKWRIFTAIGIGSFMAALDSSVVNAILPVIRDYFGSTVANVEWIVVIYLLVVSSLLLAFGRLGDIQGHKRIYVSGFLIFIAASAMCGLAPSILFLVIARGIQALGAAMLFANSPAILTRSFPTQQRGQVLGMQATMTYLGLTVGPSLGGWLTQSFGWRSIFYINVPVGLIAFGLSLAFIEVDRPDSKKREPFDFLGAVLFSTGLIALLIGLNQGQSWGWLSLTSLGCLLISAILLSFFVWFELKSQSPLLDLSLFKNRLFSACTASAVLNYVSIYSILFLLPFYLIQGRGFNPAQAGLILTAQPLMMAIAAPVSGALSDRLGSRILSTLGMAILCLGLFFLSRLGPNSSILEIIISLATAGLGTGMFVSPNTSALLGSAPRQRQGIASGILATARNVGQVFGVGLAGAIFTSVSSLPGNNPLFYAVETGLLVGSAIAGAGVLVSLVRGNK
jgi:EmrB/QacA subfamily drug resistance transporter